MKFFEDVYRIINKYNQKAKLPKTYGTEDLLYMSEIHMIEIIGSEEKVTNGKLTKILGITKGAVSQTVSKLEEKHLIEKINSPDRTNEVFIILSSKGKIVFDYHTGMHKGMADEINEVIKELPEDSLKAFSKIIDIIDLSLDKMEEKRNEI